MADTARLRDIENEKGRRRAARDWIGAYHEQQLRLLLALTLEWWREEGEDEPDWWEAGRPQRRD